VALVGGAAELASALSAARKNRLDLSVGIALGSAVQIALFVAPVPVLLSYLIGPAPMNLQFRRGAVAMMLIAAITASLVTNAGRSAWFLGVLLLTVVPDLRYDALPVATADLLTDIGRNSGDSPHSKPCSCSERQCMSAYGTHRVRR
jgi:hypothetical protein